ncbi:MAG TPA: 4-(cytidine 5'-diphospho)-2-C-methyl-D-erythritol kinase [Thermomicrobiales bacterium]|nr:4-(cytidine 5'-diphospho)-2-C-methyl-D-erythritol kinase [Thermomicrobiales bacterium]
MTASPAIRVETPAKVNLGLEILGRREDGYHELRSVLSLINITDDVTFTPTEIAGEATIQGVPGVTPSENLITRAIELFRERTESTLGMSVRVIKRIPAPAGLGSASSNAAATLLAMNKLHGSPLPESELAELGARLGSDVPFFLGTATASVSGTGTTLDPLPTPAGWLLVVMPQIDLIAKTAKLYGMIEPEDYSDGSRIDRLCDQLRAGDVVDPQLLGNAFERPLRKLMPYTRKIIRVMKAAGCEQVALSGAGPAHYALFADEDSAREAMTKVRAELGTHDYSVVTSFRPAALRDVIA